MQYKRRIIVGLCLAVAIALGFFVGKKQNFENMNTHVVRMYTVPPDQVEEVRNTLNRLFFEGKEGPYGSAQVFGNGLMLVRAPIGYQRGVRQLVEELPKQTSVKRDVVHLDYWLVIGTQDAKSDLEKVGELGKALEAIDKIDGPRKYRVIEHISSNAIVGREVKVEGWWAKATSTASVVNGQIGLMLGLDSKLGQVKTMTQVKPGEFLVLGQNVVSPEEKINGKPIAADGTANIYYVLRAEIVQ